MKLGTLYDAVVSKGSAAWELWCRGGLARFTYAPERTAPLREPLAVIGRTDMRDQKWHHVVGMYDGVNISVYVDGSLDGSERVMGIMATSPWNTYVGLNPQLARYAWNGLIDDVRIYNYALSIDEIKALALGYEFKSEGE